MLDTEGPYCRLLLEEARRQGWEDADEETVFRTIGLDDKSSRAMFRKALGPDFPYTEMSAKCVNITREQAERDGIPHRPGLLQLLDHLEARKVPKAVATSTERERALWKLDRAGISRRFDAVAGGDEVSRGKPAPDIFLLAAERLGIPPAECAGFEDSPAGLLSLHTAGIRSIFIKDLVEPDAAVLDTVWRRYESLAEAAELW
jgi:HAD superfamily hydrolase (TIGR01509 family)